MKAFEGLRPRRTTVQTRVSILGAIALNPVLILLTRKRRILQNISQVPEKIGILIPQFPGQTHIFFWREIQTTKYGRECDAFQYLAAAERADLAPLV